MKISNVNPATNKVYATIHMTTIKGIKEAVNNARKAQQNWSSMGVTNRKIAVTKLYELFIQEKDNIADKVTQTMGMPKSLRSVLDIEAGINYFNWYLNNVEKVLEPEITYKDATTTNTVHYEPTGVAAVIVPWNFPFCNFVWSVIPNLLVGNTVVFKHSEECAAFSQYLMEIILKAGLPKGVFNQVYGDGTVGKTLVNQNIDLICFTGSTVVGKYLYKVAADKLIKVVLELGGSAPGIVFEDANIDKVVDGVFFNRFANSGQICDGLKRLIVHKSIESKISDALVKMLNSKNVGDPEDPKTDIGPLVSLKQVTSLKVQVKDALRKGSKVLVTLDTPKNGSYYPPTILTNITRDMKVWREEVFGPVLPIMTFETESEAIELANDTIYGLGSYIFTEDSQKAKRVAKQLKTGMVSTNGSLYLNPDSPFGGTKQSGIGREHGKYGLQELCQIKVISEEIR